MNLKNIDYKKILENFIWKKEKQYEFSLPETEENNNYIADEDLNFSDTVFPDISSNLDYMKMKYNIMINSDIVLREFTLSARNKQFKAFLLFIDGMVDSNLINDFILKPLMLKNSSNSFNGDQNEVVFKKTTNNVVIKKIKKFDIVEYVSDCLLPQNSIKEQSKFSNILSRNKFW